MFPLRYFTLMLLSAVVIYCNDGASETLIEMKGDKLKDEQTTESERVVEAADGGKKLNELFDVGYK